MLYTKVKNLTILTFSFIAKSFIRLLIFLIMGLKPLLGPAHCKYPISCSQYAAQQLQTKPFFTALWLIVKRLLSCNPFWNSR